jgi:hypothetical protein
VQDVAANTRGAALKSDSLLKLETYDNLTEEVARIKADQNNKELMKSIELQNAGQAHPGGAAKSSASRLNIHREAAPADKGKGKGSKKPRGVGTGSMASGSMASGSVRGSESVFHVPSGASAGSTQHKLRNYGRAPSRLGSLIGTNVNASAAGSVIETSAATSVSLQQQPPQGSTVIAMDGDMDNTNVQQNFIAEILRGTPLGRELNGVTLVFLACRATHGFNKPLSCSPTT